MDAGGEFVGEQGVDDAMTLQSTLAGEGLADDINAIVRLAALARARVALVAIRFVDDI